MPLEATMMIIDNSEYMRNGDYQPTRFDAQSDAVNAVFQTKIDSNPENTVGIMTMAGKGAEVLVTHTKELGQILSAIHSASSKIGGTADIPTAIAIAQLALKHRQNKNLRQRIIVFVASPLEGAGADEKSMVRLARKLKKNNVAVDFITFGDGIEEGEKNILRGFVDAANSGENSHLLAVAPGSQLLSDAIMRSPILSSDLGIPDMDDGAGPSGGAGAGAGTGGGGGGDFEYGVDPSIDPELAMALRMSMEEETARQAAAAAAAGPSAPSAAVAGAGVQPPAATAGTAPAEPTEDEEEALLQQALALSKDEQDVDMTPQGGTSAAVEDDEEMDEDEEIARAIALSMEDPENQAEKKS